jgi:cytochrome c-type biogenesis protein
MDPTDTFFVVFAFIAGLASFFSPCVFSLVPAYIGYLGGRSAASTRGGKTDTWHTFTHGVMFVLGFSLVFMSLGFTATVLGSFLYDARQWLAKIGGIVVIIFGLHMTGLLRLKFLEYDLRPQSIPDRKRGYVASLLMGVFFSAGWAPCTGPILGSIMNVAIVGGSIGLGIFLLAAYSLGLAIPFLIASVQISLVTTALRRYGKMMHYVEIVMGGLLVIVGVLLLTGRFERLASMGTFFGAYDERVLGQALLFGILTLAFLGLLPAWLAYRKGRSFWTWWLFGATLLPVALPAALLLKEQTPETVDSDGGLTVTTADQADGKSQI